MTRVGTHTCWTTWGPGVIDRPERLRKLTRIRRHLGERRYRELRYSMSVARSRLELFRLIREMGVLRSELDKLPLRPGYSAQRNVIGERKHDGMHR